MHHQHQKRLKPKILIVEPNSKNPAIKVAKKLKIPICEIQTKENMPSGMFDLFEIKKIKSPTKKSKEPSFIAVSYTHLTLPTKA